MYRGIKKQNNILQVASLLFCLISLIFLIPSGAYAAAFSTVTLPIEQEFITDQTDLSVSVEYVLIAVESGNPMPEGSTGNSYTVTLSAEQKTVNIVITFTKPGTYQYELTEKIPSDFPFTWKSETYRITILVGQDFTTILTIKNNDGKKVSVMSWSYAEIFEPTPIPTATPGHTVKPTPGGAGNIAKPSTVPQTGDQSAMALWIFIGVLSSLGLLCCGYLLYRMHKREMRTDE